MSPKETPMERKLEIVTELLKIAGDVDTYPSWNEASEYVGSTWPAIYSWYRKDEQINEIVSEAKLKRAEAYVAKAKRVLDAIQDFWTDSQGITRERMQAVNKAKLMIEHYRWHAGNLAPDCYGDYYYQLKEQDKKIAVMQQQLTDLINNRGR